MKVHRLSALRAERLRKQRLVTIHDINEARFSSLKAMAAGSAAMPVATQSRQGFSSPSTVAALRILLVALLLGWFADYLFFGLSLGISVPIFVVVFLLALFLTPFAQGIKPVISNLWLLLPTFFFAVMVFVRANAFLTVLNLSATVILVCLVIYFSTAGRVERLQLAGYPAAIAVVVGQLLTRTMPTVVTLGGAAMQRRHKAGVLVPVLRGFVIAVPVLFIFGALLASADTVFERMIEDFFKLKIFNTFTDLPQHLLIVLGATWLIAGGMLITLERGRKRNADRERGDAALSLPSISPLIGFVEGATILGLVNLLFAVFAWIQFSHIFFGQPTGMPYEEYREYIHKGFGELLVACVLTIVLILGVRLLVRTPTVLQERSLLALSTIMILLTFVMLVSAYERMQAWEDVQFYINTPVRIYVRTFILWLGVVFTWLAFTMWFRRERFAIGAFIAAIGFLVTVNFANPDADVAAFNLRRHDELSIRYLDLLSDDAVPELVHGMHESTDPVIHESLRRNLAERLSVLENDPNRQSWQSFHLSRSNAYELLDEMNRKGEFVVSP